MVVSGILQGGLGNCLFIISAIISHSLKYKIDYCIPKGIVNPHFDGQKVFFSRYLNYCDYGVITAMMYVEPSFEYAEIPTPQSNFTLLQGYFQSWKYIEPYREQILEILDIPYEFKEGYIAIHYRLGDFRNIPNCHPPVTLEYIHAGIKYFTDRGYKKFVVCSDEIDYAYDNIKIPEGCHFEFSEGRTDIEDLTLLSCCEHLIGSNSSFSWWAYYLNQNEDKLGIFPTKDKWFGADLKHNVDDLYDPTWILL